MLAAVASLAALPVCVGGAEFDDGVVAHQKGDFARARSVFSAMRARLEGYLAARPCAADFMPAAIEGR